MARRKSKLTDADEIILADEIIPWFQHRKWFRTELAAIWAKCGGAALGASFLIEVGRWVWVHLGGGSGGGIP